MTLKAIIFDMDGVIVDTEFCDFQIVKDFIHAENPKLDMDRTDFTELIGRSYDNLYRSIKHFAASEESFQEVGKKFHAYSDHKYDTLDYMSLMRQDIVHVLKYAKEHQIKLAVASSSRYDHIVEVLTACGIKDYFDFIFSGEVLAESKPNPEIYLKTLAKLNVLPHEAVAIEDSFYGITAAHAAGIPVVAYEEKRVPIDQSHADFLVQDMQGFFEVVKELHQANR